MAKSHHETRIKAISGWNCGGLSKGVRTRRLRGRLGVGMGVLRTGYGSGVRQWQPIRPVQAGISCNNSGQGGLRRRRAPGTRGCRVCQCQPEPVRYRRPETARTMPEEIVRELDDYDAAIPHYAPEHFRARATRRTEPCREALDASEDQRPERQQVPGQARHGREEAEGWHRGGLYAQVGRGWISSPSPPVAKGREGRGQSTGWRPARSGCAGLRQT
jgi:hypothetical protein